MQDETNLQRLIRERLSDQGWTPGTVEKRSGLSRATLYAILRRKNPKPDFITIHRIAIGLGVPLSVVIAAQLNLDETNPLDDLSDPDLRKLIALWSQLDQNDRHSLLRFAQESVLRSASNGHPE